MKKIFILLSVLVLVLFIFETKVIANEGTSITTDELKDKESGTYPVKIVYVDEETQETVEKIVYMTVYYPNTIVNIADGEAIDAMDVLSNEIVSNFSKEQFIEKAKVKAWKINDGSPIEITNVEIINIKDTTDEGKIYTVNFSTQKGTTIQVTFLENENQNFFVQEETYMSDFSIFDNQIKDWLYISIAVFIFIPLSFIIIAFFRMLKLVKKTQKLLYKEYNNI